MLSRRRFLASTALVGLAALLPAWARAFSIEAADAETGQLYLAACGQQDVETHRRMVDELRTTLADRDAAEIERAIAEALCPVCGCGLVADRR